MEFKNEHPPYAWAGLAGAILLAIYVATLSPTTAFWDTSEYIAAAKVLGIPHPPGNPLFTVLAHTWGLLPLAADYAVRINLFAAVTSALSAALWFLIGERWLRTIVPVRWARLTAAFAGVLIAGTAWTVWNQSVVNEKVYTVSMLSVALVVWLAVHWGDAEPGPSRDRWLVLIAYITALTSTNHLMGVLGAPAVAVYVLWTEPRVVFRPWAPLLGWFLALAIFNHLPDLLHPGAGSGPLLVTVVTAGLVAYALWRSPRDPLVYLAIGAVIVGISLNYVYLPIRAAQYPPINEGEPLGFFSQALMDVLNRVQYGKPSLMDRQAPFYYQMATFFQYFGWQWARDWGALGALATGLFTLLGLLGLGGLWRTNRRAAVAAIALLGTLSVALVFYMNFKYGFSIAPQLGNTVPREVRERDYFFIGAFSVWGVCAGIGIGVVMRWIADFTTRAGTAPARWAAASPVLALALIPLLGNRITASRAHETMARDIAVDMLESVAPYGILITAGDNDTFPLWFAQEVLGVRRDVTLANLSLLNTDWHLRQLRRRVTPPFDVAHAIPYWKQRIQAGDVPGAVGGNVLTPPTNPVFEWTQAQLDTLADLTPIQKDLPLRFDSLQLTVNGTFIPQANAYYLEKSDLATLALIHDNLGKRPIYFSWTDSNHPDRTFGLTPYLVTEGMVRRVNLTPVKPDQNVVWSPGIGYVDLNATDHLLWDVYHWQSAARPRPRGWVDAPSASILTIYAIVYQAMGDLYRQHGDTTKANRAEQVYQGIAAEMPR
ncbi:MAG TPA: DUF2723 domain-containing protein [Gemmatimonadales bacterium]|nr:DUF2723 domain-containing protein [Gemmatimonadales bacterium]